ncbi:VOC family protein [Pedobacter rhodius]|uniref:VOC family protein n=1 Tax=Pedobacter rhodius TaxID=3004098 RepID=A0ABT4KYI8_9SPHI|nr:VOC family protein [Pedobacter sp. SJ11]MCZ4224006.1 VOC family protein [Pedobacter sp. SJ11]
METKMIWANLAVKDLEITAKFYSDLGFKPNGTFNADLVSFLFGKDNFIIHFFLAKQFKNAARLENAALNTGTEIIFSLSADSREEVDLWLERVKKAGATIYAEAEDFDKGYTFGFSDPDGHKFNVLYWPSY